MAARRKAAKKAAPILPKPGKRDLFTAEHERLFLQLLQACMHQSEAARKLGFTPQAISMRKKRDARFAEAVAQAEASAEFGLIATILKASTKDYRAAQFLIERRFKERWSRPEIQQQLNITSVDANELAKAIQDGLEAVARRHANFSLPDADAVDEGAGE